MANRRLLIAGNWKMHHGAAETTDFLQRLLAQNIPATVDTVVCPPYLSIPAAATILSASQVGLGAQNVHWQTTGAFTGEVAPSMLSEVGARWVIVGHSERRTLFAETDQSTARRARAAQEAELQVIYCIGETLDQRESGDTMTVLATQTSVLAGLDPARLVIAYEPVWAIGTGHTATPEQAQEAHAFIRGRLATILGTEAADGTRILYGGSMKPSNAHDLLRRADVDGGLIGGASLDVDSFSAIIRAAADCAAGDAS
jgi:triosephosphate isomerase